MIASHWIGVTPRISLRDEYASGSQFLLVVATTDVSAVTIRTASSGRSLQRCEGGEGHKRGNNCSLQKDLLHMNNVKQNNKSNTNSEGHYIVTKFHNETNMRVP